MKLQENLLLAAAALLLAGCANNNAVYVDPNSGQGIVSLDKINVQDFANAAESMLQSLYDSPAFAGARREGGAPVLMVGRVRNDTSSIFDVDMLNKKLTVSLTRSGKVRVAKAAGPKLPNMPKLNDFQFFNQDRIVGACVADTVRHCSCLGAAAAVCV